MRLAGLSCVILGCAIFSGMSSAPLFAQAAAGPLLSHPAPVAPSDEKTLSVRIVAYTIDAKLDPTKHVIDATETLTYRNLTGKPQQTFPFHMYLNAFQPQSTFMTEVRRAGTRGSGPDTAWDPKHFGAITMEKLEAEGSGDLTSKMATPKIAPSFRSPSINPSLPVPP